MSVEKKSLINYRTAVSKATKTPSRTVSLSKGTHLSSRVGVIGSKGVSVSKGTVSMSKRLSKRLSKGTVSLSKRLSKGTARLSKRLSKGTVSLSKRFSKQI